MALQAWGTPQHVVDRYYQKSFAIDIKGVTRQDQCVLQHSNKVCVVCIAPSHALLLSEPIRVDFNVNEKTDRSQSKVRGKRKKGGQWLTAYSPLCKVYCKDEQEFMLYSCIRGDLLEVNEALVSNPALLKSWPMTNGYIAVLMPKHHERSVVVDDLLTEEQYLAALEKRKEAAVNAETGESIDSTETGNAAEPADVEDSGTKTGEHSAYLCTADTSKSNPDSKSNVDSLVGAGSGDQSDAVAMESPEDQIVT